MIQPDHLRARILLGAEEEIKLKKSRSASAAPFRTIFPTLLQPTQAASPTSSSAAALSNFSRA